MAGNGSNAFQGFNGQTPKTATVDSGGSGIDNIMSAVSSIKGGSGSGSGSGGGSNNGSNE